MDLMTANKMMAEILAMCNDAEGFDFIRFDREFQRIADQAAQISQIINSQGN
jgi:hypothetical protein